MKTLALAALIVLAGGGGDPDGAALLEIVPARAGKLELRGAWVQPRSLSSRVVFGQYTWVSAVDLPPLDPRFDSHRYSKDATITCRPGDEPLQDCDERGDKKIKIAGTAACWSSEDPKLALGVSVGWGGCLLQFVPGELKARGRQALVDAASSAIAWTTKARAGDLSDVDRLQHLNAISVALKAWELNNRP